MPSAGELIAHDRSEEEIARLIGADRLIYQDLDDLVAAVKHGNRALTRFDASCFNGEYVTGDVTSDYLEALDQLRNDDAKSHRENADSLVDLQSEPD